MEIFCFAKALGLGTYFGAKAQRWVMVTGQIDTCITGYLNCNKERVSLNIIQKETTLLSIQKDKEVHEIPVI